jgi:PAS domain-containing protein
MALSDIPPQAILDALSDGLVIVDSSGITCYVNPAWQRQVAERGHAAAFGTGSSFARNFVAAFAPDDGDEHTIAAAIQAVVRGTHQRFDCIYSYDAENRRRWFTVVITPCEAGHERWVLVQQREIEHSVPLGDDPPDDCHFWQRVVGGPVQGTGRRKR